MRCKAVSETAAGEYNRCQQMTYGEQDALCYYHAKMMGKLLTPADRDWTDPDRVVALHVQDGKQLTKVGSYSYEGE